MIPSGLFTQIALIIISVGIILTYITPTFENISTAQEQIAVYQDELGQVSAVNALLQTKLQQIDQVSDTDLNRLLTYIPDTIDVLAVMRDLENITNQSGARVIDITDNGPLEETTESREQRRGSVDEGPYPYIFALTVEGTYNQVKELITLMENNEYPLEPRRVLLEVSEGGFIQATIDVHTYSQFETAVPDVRLYQDVNVTYE